MLQFAKFIDVEWKTFAIPELIWIMLINEKYGLAEGAELCLSLSQEVHKIVDVKKNKSHFFMISAYKTLSNRQKNRILNVLEQGEKLKQLQNALAPLIFFYPACPLKFLFKKDNVALKGNINLYFFKNSLKKMFDRHGVDATFVQANAIYIAFVSGRLKVVKGMALADFPEVQFFPFTDRSKEIASSIRATLNMYFGPTEGEYSKKWSEYFWNRGIKLEKCNIIDYYEKEEN